jgi:hypothetical protein
MLVIPEARNWVLGALSLNAWETDRKFVLRRQHQFVDASNTRDSGNSSRAVLININNATFTVAFFFFKNFRKNEIIIWPFSTKNVGLRSGDKKTYFLHNKITNRRKK